MGPLADPEARPGERAAAIGLIVAGAALASAPVLLHRALPRGSDCWAILHYCREWAEAARGGDLLPRWTPSTNLGLGAPTFVLYPPAFFALATAGAALFGDLVQGIRAVLVGATFLTAFAMNAFLRDLGLARLVAAAGSVTFVLMPYRMLDVHQRFALPEALAFAALPLVALWGRRLAAGERRDGRAVVAFAASLAALAATHLVTAFLVTGAALAVAAAGAAGAFRVPRRAWLLPAAAAGLGLALAGPVLLPAALEKDAAHSEYFRLQPNGDYRINFLYRDDLLPKLGIPDPIRGPVRRTAHAALALSAVALVVLALLEPSALRARGTVTLAAAGAPLGYLMQLELSAPIWRLVPALATVQFPWRFQMLQGFAAVVLAAAAAEAALRRPPAKESRPLLLALAAAAVAWGFAARGTTTLKPYDVDAAFLEDPRLVGWKDPALTPRGFPHFEDFRFETPPIPDSGFVGTPGRVELVRTGSRTFRAETESPGGGTARLRHFWFPGWGAELAGRELPLRADPELGLLAFDVPAGRHTVDLRFGTTPPRRAGAALGAAAALTAAVLLLRRRRET